jgi:hypothetical protein
VYGLPVLRSIRVAPFSFDRGKLVRALAAAGLLVACVAPWWALSWRWCHTFLFPLMRGNYNSDYGMYGGMTGFEWMHYFWAQASFDAPIRTVPLFLFAAVTLFRGERRRVLACFVVAVTLGWVALVKAVPDSDTPLAIARYHFGFTFAAIIAIVLAAADASVRRGGGGRASAADAAALTLVVAGLALQIHDDRKGTRDQYDQYITALEKDDEGAKAWDFPKPPPWGFAYHILQEPIPPSEPIAVMVDDPFQFDLRRNEVHSLDIVGAVSPPPRLPIFAGPEQVASYLVGLGYKYLVVVDPTKSRSLYRRDTWQKQQIDSARAYMRTAIYYLTAFDVFDALTRTRAHLAEANGMVTLDLTHPVP